MSIVPKTEKTTNSGPARRRRKKRRTEDFSDSSDSSSSSDSGSGDEENQKNDDVTKQNEGIVADVDVDVDGDVVLDDTEIQIENENFDITKEKLKIVTLTKTAMNERTKNFNTTEVENTLTRNRKDLENEYLGLMLENYGEDMNKLRTAPDFNERSLGILANALKNGSNIFDEDTLKAVVKK